MRFLVDECTGPVVARWLRGHGHEVFSVYESARGEEDERVLQKAFDENWILITNDKGFGERAYRLAQPHRGIVLLRLRDERPIAKIRALERVLAAHADQLPDSFVVVTAEHIRVGR